VKLNDSIRLIRKKLGLTQTEFANKLGIKRSLIGAYEEGRAEPRLELLNKMAQIGGLSLEAVLNGHSIENQIDKRSGSRGWQRSPEGNIQLVPVKAAAGYLKGFGDQEAVKELPTFTLPMLGKGKYRAFEISGDSMLPLASGTVVVGEQVEKLAEMKSGKTFVLITKRDGIVYKRVFTYLKENGKFFLVSDNPGFKPYAIDPEEILEVWAAKAYISIQFPDIESTFAPFEGAVN
jgi:transcriptional regulator with XRE-family HTH domain